MPPAHLPGFKRYHYHKPDKGKPLCFITAVLEYEKEVFLLKKLLAAALAKEPADLLLKGGRIANLYTMEYECKDVAIKDGIIVGVGEGYQAKETVDCAGCVIAPSFIEGHMHVESTYMVPRNLAAAIAPHGTGTVMADPHEIANTCGMDGIRFMYRESEGLPLDIYYGAPSCVPASEMESPFKPLDAGDVKALFDEGICTHLGEMMNFPGVIMGDDGTWAKLDAAKGRVITGHAPGVTGKELAAYMLGGITSDHECSSSDGAMEKLRRGMYVMIRQGATARNLESLIGLVKNAPQLSARCMLVSDDTTPEFIHSRGHLDGCVREAIECGVAPLAALRMVTLTPAEYFRLNDRGAIAPGKTADIVLLDSVEKCSVIKVWKRGRLAAENGNILKKPVPAIISELPGYKGTVRTPLPDEIKVPLPRAGAKLNAIDVIEHQIITKTLVLEPEVKDGMAVPCKVRDIAKMVVVEKNQGTGRVAIGFLKGFGLERGAIASSIAHDAHNFSCAGMDDESICTALAAIAKTGGGLAVALGDKILAHLELPVGGLMSPLPLEYLIEGISAPMEAVKKLGCRDNEAFMHLAFLSLSVIPELKLTDNGYFDISTYRAFPLWADDIQA